MSAPAYAPSRRNATKAHAQTRLTSALKSGEVVRPDACERCGEAGRVQGHHYDYTLPLDVEWLCARCHAAEHRSRPDWVIAAEVLYENGMPIKEIAENVGKTYSGVYRRLKREKTVAYNHESNKRRRQMKREHERARLRSREMRGTCQSCDGPMGVGVGHDGTCLKCREKAAALTNDQMARRAEALWAEGLRIKEMAKILGLAKGSLGWKIGKWRKEGYEFPFRNNKVGPNGEYIRRAGKTSATVS